MTTCLHGPACPPAHRHDRDAGRVVSAHPEQGWSLCNGVVVFDDLGQLLPDGSAVDPPHTPAAPLAAAA